MCIFKNNIIELLNVNNASIGSGSGGVDFTQVDTEETLKITLNSQTNRWYLETLENKIAEKITTLDGGTL